MARVDKLKAFCCPANIDGELSFSINDPIGIGFKYYDRSEPDDINEYTKIEGYILLYACSSLFFVYFAEVVVNDLIQVFLYEILTIQVRE